MKIPNTPAASVLSMAIGFSIVGACSSGRVSTFDSGTGSGTAGSSSGSPGAGGSAPAGGTLTGMIGIPGGATGAGGSGSGTPHPCVNLECQKTNCTLGACQQMPCANGAKTTLSGIVYDPAGKVPLYNVIVYVPNAEPAPFAAGATCDRCSTNSLNSVAAALTDTHGHFVLNDVPVGSDIPLVIQIGKWRRQVKLPSVARCVDTPVEAALTHLPRNKAEGDIPLIAITTGGADSMECLPLRMGIDPAEFTTETGNGRLHLYFGQDSTVDISTKSFDATLNGGAMLSQAPALWNSVDTMKKYDIVILSCEGALNPQEKLPPARQALYDYASAGGRVFASHWHHLWFSGGPAPVPQIATWRDLRDPIDPSIGIINTTFPKGQAMSEWLVNVGASTMPGQLEIHAPRDNVTRVNATMATEWIKLQNVGQTVEFLSFNAPLGAADDMLCGRAIYSDLHVSSTTGDTPGTPFPASCVKGDLSAQEKALEFMLFDLSSCVTPDDKPPPPPR